MNETIKTQTLPGGQRLELARGDITEDAVDAIVNAANAQLVHGAGVAGAISRKGGAVIQAESKRWVEEHGTVSYAEPAVTHAGSLPCRCVIHAVGPIWGVGGEDNKLRTTIQSALGMADRLKLGSIAFPAISTGIFGFPRRRAARVILAGIVDYFKNTSESGLKLVRLVLFDQDTLQAFTESWEQDDHFTA